MQHVFVFLLLNVCVCFRFFVMYLINKDETEHTGQVKQLLILCLTVL